MSFQYGIANRALEDRPGAPGSRGEIAIPSYFIYEAAQVIEIVQNEDSRLKDAANSQSTINTGIVKVRFTVNDADVGGDIAREFAGVQGELRRIREGLRNKQPPTNIQDKLEDTFAYPLIPNQSLYPLVGEFVLVFKLINKYFYIGPINTNLKITQNASPIPNNSVAEAKNQREVLQQQIRQGVTTRLLGGSVRPRVAGLEFKELNVNPLKVFEGDIIYEGRYGNSIRFGSSISSPNQDEKNQQAPNLLFRVGQSQASRNTADDKSLAGRTIEDFNTDASSIYLTTNQTIFFTPATFASNTHLASVTGDKPSWTGAQVLINSDQVAINAKYNSIYLFARKGVHINALTDGVTIDSAGDIVLKTPAELELFSEKSMEIGGKQDITITTKRDVTISGDRYISVYGNEIFLGGRGLQASPMVLGRPLKMFLFELLRVMMTNPAMIGAGAPNPAYIARILLLFTKYRIFPDPFNPLFNSDDNFVMKTNERSLASDLPPNRGFRQTGLGKSVISTQAPRPYGVRPPVV